MANNNQVLLTGLSLIQDSPFKNTQSPILNKENDSVFQNLNEDVNSSYDNLYNFLKSDYQEHVNKNGIITSNPTGDKGSDSDTNDVNYLNDSYKFYLSELSNTLINNEINKGDSSFNSFGNADTSFGSVYDDNSNNNNKLGNIEKIKLSDDIKTLFNVTKNSNTNDLILKILIENSLYNLNHYLESENDLEFVEKSLNPQNVSFLKSRNDTTSTILSLDEIKNLKFAIMKKFKEKAKLTKQIDETVQSLNEILRKYDEQDKANSSKNKDFRPNSRESKIEFENIVQINSQLERQLISSNMQKYLTGVEQLRTIESQIQSDKKLLFNHFYTCLVIGYINNITINLKLQKNLQYDNLSQVSTPKSTTFTDAYRSPIMDFKSPTLGSAKKSTLQMIENKTAIFNKSIDEIVSHIANLAVQRDVQLPEPTDKRSSMLVSNYNINNNSEIISKTLWVKKCINKLLSFENEAIAHDSNLRENVHFRDPSFSPESMSVASNSPSKHVQTLISPVLNKSDSPINSRSSSSNNYRDKELNDLKTKVKDLKFANDYLTKQFKAEREQFNKIMAEQNLAKLNLEKKLSNSIQNLEKTNEILMQTEVSNQALEQKLDENFKMINDLKKKITNLQIENLGSPMKNKDDYGNKSTLNDSFADVSLELQEADRDVYSNSFNSSAPNLGSSNSPSVGIMRKEFKKIIDDINQKHYLELSKEITERKRLESLLKMYKDEKM